MTAILIITGICVFFIFRDQWKKCLYLLIFMLPFFGYIQLKILHLTGVAPLIQDITVILPMYFLFILHRMKTENTQFYLPSYFNNFLLFFILFIIVFAINPFFETNLITRLVGVKVWIFYILFILLGFEFIESVSENELELKKFCNFFAIIAIIPCVIGILQYLGSYYLDFRTTMTFFYGGNVMHAQMATQNFSFFDWGSGVKVFRLPSTFSFTSQFHVFTLAAIVPAIAAVGFSETNKEKYFYSMIVVLVVLAAYSSGARATTINYLLFFIFLILRHTKFYIVLMLSVLMVIIVSTINLQSFPFLQSIIVNVTDITVANVEGYIFEDYGYLLSNYFLGAGVGSATPEARYIVDTTQSLRIIHEGYYHKAIKELGAFGLLVVVAFLGIMIYEIILSVRSLKDNRTSLFCSAVLALFLLSVINVTKGATIFTKFPSNFLLYFYLGIAIKLRFLNLDNEKNQ